MNLATSLETVIQTRLIEAATGKILRESAPRKNLIMDGGLNALAQSTNATRLSAFAATCRVGSGTTPTSYASGAVTFTQSSTTVTASGSFFTAAMVGMILKYGSGSGGAEAYIVTYTSATQVTVNTTATVGATVGTVWAANQTALTTLLYSTSAVETTPGSCGTTFTSNVASFKRTFNFAQQASPYNVNEIGYFTSTTGTTVFGRIVLSSTDVVPPTAFYQVTLTISVTFTPAAPAAAANVGTNIDTAGSAMLECINASSVLGIIDSVGVAGAAGALDYAGSGTSARLILITASYEQNASCGNVVAVTRQDVPVNTSWVYAGVRGKKTMTLNTTISTSGQTLYGIGMSGGAVTSSFFDIKLATPFTLPTGSFLPQAVFSVTYDRNLTN